MTISEFEDSWCHSQGDCRDLGGQTFVAKAQLEIPLTEASPCRGELGREALDASLPMSSEPVDVDVGLGELQGRSCGRL